MLLLYRIRSGWGTEGGHLFTFHYASTLSDPRTPGNLPGVPHLHSTMLLLYRSSDTHEGCHAVFTFHYASTLSFTWNIFNVMIEIYIPLCFYFIEYSECCQKQNVKFTFHYASTLSKVAIMNPYFVYLFTFHYASTLSISVIFYWAAAPWFTFHYASTLSSSDEGASYCYTLFTFHYASTLSGDWIKHKWRHLYLHSTMLLLYLWFRCHTGGSDWHLHSTMLLLYRFPSRLCALSFKDLHSTMLLLYRFWRIRRPLLHLYLHSTMLLLYRCRYYPCSWYLPIYIPLCFYFIFSATV